MTFFDGYKRNIIDYVYTDIHESAFNGREVPIMNTPEWVDIYLIQNCPFEFIQKRMKEVYTEQSYKRISKVNLSALPPKHLQKNRRVVIKTIEKTRFPIHNKPYKYKGKTKWMVEPETPLWEYNEETNTWVSPEIYYPTTSCSAYFGSLKAVVRNLRNQYLPTGIKFYILGEYVGEDYVAIIK